MLRVLERYGITAFDLLRAVNDTTNSALAAGCLILGGGIDQKHESGTCMMHVVSNEDGVRPGP